MKITVIQPVLIKWVAPSNSNLNGTIAAKLPSKVWGFNSHHAPQIGERLVVNDSDELTITDILRTVETYSSQDVESYRITVAPLVLEVNYYAYHKKFTHKCDGMKLPNDPTVDMSKVNEPVTYPDTWGEWKRRAAQLD